MTHDEYDIAHVASIMARFVQEAGLEARDGISALRLAQRMLDGRAFGMEPPDRTKRSGRASRLRRPRSQSVPEDGALPWRKSP